MSREDLLKDMKESIGTKDPIEYFDKLTDVLTLLFDRIDDLEKTVDRLTVQSALAIQWDPRLASDMLAKEVTKLRTADKDGYAVEISALKVAFAEDKVTQSYDEFVNFWRDTLGFHPFLD
jgi:hypothetical protein